MGIEQLDQHFIFNAINTIACIVEGDPPGGRELLIDFADYLRLQMAMAGGKTQVTVEQEVSMLCGYLHIQHVRFEDRVNIEAQVLCEREKKIPVGSIFYPVEELLKETLKERGRKLVATLQITLEVNSLRIELRGLDLEKGWDVPILKE